MALQKKDVTPELLAAKAAQYSEAKGDNDPRYIKMPRTWLEEECWLEDPQPSGRKKPSKGVKNSQDGKTKRENRTTKTKMQAKATPKSKRNRPKKQAAAKSVECNAFHNAVPIYCDFLGITLDDLAAATGIGAPALRRTCAGKSKMPNATKNKLRSLLIEAVMYLPDDEPSSVADLRGYYENWIKDKPLTNYAWRRPEYYTKQRQAQVAPMNSKPRHYTSTTNDTRAANSSGPGATANDHTGDAMQEDRRTELDGTSGKVEMSANNLHDYVISSIKAGKLKTRQAKDTQTAMGVVRIRDLDTPEKIAKAKAIIDDFIAGNAVEMSLTNFYDYVTGATKTGKLTVRQGKEMMKAMGIQRIRELDTPEKIAKGKEMIDGFIAENAATV
jgi:hypothetical protein